MEVCPKDKTYSLEIRFDDDGMISLSRCCFLYAFAHLSLEAYSKIEDIIDYAENSTINYAKSSNICIAECHLEKKIKQVDVGISHACNMNCYNCFFNEHKDTPEMKKAYFDTLYKIKGHQLDTIMMNNGGEVFVYYDEIIEYLKSLTLDDTRQVTFITNLVLLNEDRLKELKQISDATGINYFFLPSVDGITKETYEATRIGGKFAKITENLRLLCDIFTPKNAVVLFTIKKPNISDAKQVEDYFKINFGLKSSISFDVYDKECERVYNSIFRKGIELPSSKGYNFKIKKESGKYLTIITKKPLSKENIAKYSKYEFIEIHSYCGKNGKNLPKNIKYFKKTDNIFYIESLKQKNKYILFLDDISNLKIDNPKILEYFLSKTKESFLFINYDKKTIVNSKLSMPLINREIYSDLLSFFNPKTSIFWSQILIGEQVLVSKYNFIEVPNNVMCLNVSQKRLTKFLKKWKKCYGILPYSE